MFDRINKPDSIFAPIESEGLRLLSTLRRGGGLTSLGPSGLETQLDLSGFPVPLPDGNAASPDTPTLPLPRLTRREGDVLLWAARGKTAWETAQLLGLTERTVKFYLARACARLEVRNKTHAVALCLKHGLIDL